MSAEPSRSPRLSVLRQAPISTFSSPCTTMPIPIPFQTRRLPHRAPVRVFLCSSLPARLLGKAAEWTVIAIAPRLKLMKELGREEIIDPESEVKLAKQPMKDVLHRRARHRAASGGSLSRPN